MGDNAASSWTISNLLSAATADEEPSPYEQEDQQVSRRGRERSRSVERSRSNNYGDDQDEEIATTPRFNKTSLQEEKEILSWALTQLYQIEERKKNKDFAKDPVEEPKRRFSFGSTSSKTGIPAYDEHLGESRQYWRDIILGVNDGLVSTFLLVSGVTGANLSNEDILLTAIAGTIAGAISMAAGEYIATKTQEEVMDGEVNLERRHIKEHKEVELGEVGPSLEKIGIVASPDDDKKDAAEVAELHRRLLNFYRKRDDSHLALHVALEFGVIEDEKRNPLVAGFVSFFLFFFGAMPSVIPFTFIKEVDVAFFVSGACTTFALLLVGAIKTWATRGNLFVAAMENLLVSAGGGAIAYIVGVFFEGLVNSEGTHIH